MHLIPGYFSFLILQSLGFDLIVYAPYRSIEGFIEDMEVKCSNFLFVACGKLSFD